MKNPLLTVSMIVRNEEKYLEDCLKSVKGAAGEIVVVDTGSTDNTIQIAQSFGAKVYKFEWVEDFSAARNFALEKSTGKWVLYLDADERIDPSSLTELGAAVSCDSMTAWYCNVISIDNHNGKHNSIKYPRLFRNSENIRFEGRIHEQIDVSLKENGYEFCDSSINIFHVGYDIKEEDLKKKAERNLKLLLLDYNDNPTDYVSFQLAQTYAVLGDNTTAAEYFRKLVNSPSSPASFKAHSYRFIATIQFSRGDVDSALENTLAGIKYGPSQPLLLYLMANILVVKKEYPEALKYIIAAFQNNNLTDSKDFKLSMDWDKLIYAAMDISAINRNARYFMYLYEEFSRRTGEKPHEIYGVIKETLKGLPLSGDQVKALANALNEKNLHIFMPVLTCSNNLHEILHKLKTWEVTPDLILKGAEFLSENGYIAEAEIFYYFYIENTFVDPSAAFLLISFLVGKGDITGIREIIDKTEQKFNSNLAVHDKLNLLKLRLNIL